MKKILLLFIVAILVFNISACNDESEGNDNLSVDETTEKESVDEFEIIDKFIGLYNASNKNPIKNIKKMDIQGKDYQTEFRLNSFKNAVGKKGTINNSTINIVNYGAWGNDSIRFYIQTKSSKETINIYIKLIHILDKAITDKEIKESYNSLDDGFDANILMGDSNCISGYIKKYEMMIDCSKLKFID